MKGKGRSVALASAAAGLIVLVAAGFVLRRPLIEQLHLHRFAIGDDAAKVQAAKALGEMGSIRGFEEIFLAHARSFREQDFRGVGPPGVGIVDGKETIDWTCSMVLFGLLMKEGQEEIKSFLIQSLTDEDDRIRMLAANFLSSFGRAVALPAGQTLHAMLSDPKKAVRISAAMALASIGDPSGDARRALRDALHDASQNERGQLQEAIDRLEGRPSRAISPDYFPSAR
jgi:HEAT repeat protein